MNEWCNISEITSKSYKCGFCGNKIASNKGYFTRNDFGQIYICHKCNKPTFFDYSNNKTPGTLYGKEFTVNIPEDIEQ